MKMLSDCHPVICCTASRRVEGAEASEYGYIQGAGDDSEGWSRGLTPAILWRYQDRLMKAVEADLPDIIAELTVSERSPAVFERPVLVAPTQSVYIYKNTGIQDLPVKEFNVVVLCVSNSSGDGMPQANGVKNLLRLRCGVGKLGSRDLRNQLPRIHKFVSGIAKIENAPKMLFACPTGTDLSIGVALAVLCLFFDANGESGRSII